MRLPYGASFTLNAVSVVCSSCLHANTIKDDNTLPKNYFYLLLLQACGQQLVFRQMSFDVQADGRQYLCSSGLFSGSGNKFTALVRQVFYACQDLTVQFPELVLLFRLITDQSGAIRSRQGTGRISIRDLFVE